MDWLARQGADGRFIVLLLGGASLTGLLSTILVLMTGIGLPMDFALIAGFLGIGTLLRTVVPALLLWLLMNAVTRWAHIGRRTGAVAAAFMIAAMGWLIFVDLAQDILGPRIWGSSASRTGITALAILGFMIMPALAAWIYRPCVSRYKL